ncbi:MAG: MBL fold metallo-hydrolase [Actinobacteria bacterium]|nr:MBL fold metallo-hydrolase [Actinomycetota bacterium]
MFAKFKDAQKKADEAWASYRPEPFGDIGSVDKLSILPRSEWYTENSDLLGEAGVSYLIQADGKRILFDVGANWKKEDPSPLVRNMKTLGVTADSLDAIVISHPHCDHLGGMAAQRVDTFMFSLTDADLTGITAYVPAPLTHPTATTELTVRPNVIFPGVTTIGVILRALWPFGLTPEQAIAVNVRDEGPVVIIGCGHQGMSRILERTRQLFPGPIYALVGGLHFPVTKSRVKFGMQKWIGTGKLPYQRIKRAEVDAAVAELKAANPSVVGISAHDSCDWSLGRFREAFGDRYREVAVGREITF